MGGLLLRSDFDPLSPLTQADLARRTSDPKKPRNFAERLGNRSTNVLHK